MATAKVKHNSTGGKGQARFCRRAEAKEGSRKRRRRAGRLLARAGIQSRGVDDLTDGRSHV